MESTLAKIEDLLFNGETNNLAAHHVRRWEVETDNVMTSILIEGDDFITRYKRKYAEFGNIVSKLHHSDVFEYITIEAITTIYAMSMNERLFYSMLSYYYLKAKIENDSTDLDGVEIDFNNAFAKQTTINEIMNIIAKRREIFNYIIPWSVYRRTSETV